MTIYLIRPIVLSCYLLSILMFNSLVGENISLGKQMLFASDKHLIKAKDLAR